MNRILQLLLFLFLLSSVKTNAQNTVGLLSYNPSQAYEGYNLLYPHNQPNVYLINNCGEIVKVWEDDPSFRPGNTAYLMENGNLIKTKRPASIAGNTIWAGGGGAIVEIRDWDNNLIWDFELNDSLHRLHHDIAPMPNGNILMIAWELKTKAEAIAAGRDTNLLVDDVLWPDYIIEVNPNLDSIVWEWHSWDHLVQDFDSTKANYDVVGNRPHRIDLNWVFDDGGNDWMHSNAIDYNPELDQIMLSVPNFHEIWIIDHSTTTAQAATSNGGFSGLGGDLMYRWGNPATYRAGTTADQKLFYQHDAHWADRHLDPSHPEWGKIVVFNNRVGADYSTVNTFTAPFDMYNTSYPRTTGPWEPSAFDRTILHPVDSTLMYSTGLSGAQILPNGNILTCVGRFGYSFETTPDGEIVWEYKTPLRGGNAVEQGDTLQINNNLTFRLNRYPMDFAAFTGRNLEPGGYLELNPDTTLCNLILSDKTAPTRNQLQLYPNPARDMVTVEWEGQRISYIKVYDMLGRQLQKVMASGGRKYLDTSNWTPGIYLVQVDEGEMVKLVVME